MNQQQCDSNETQQQELFYNAIINDGLNWIQTFLNDPSTSKLYLQFKYTINTIIDELPLDTTFSPIIIAIINNKLSILQCLIQHHQQQQQHEEPINPSIYIEHDRPFYVFLPPNVSIEMMDYIYSLYSTEPSTIEATLRSIFPSSNYNNLLFTTPTYKLHHIQRLIQHYKCNYLTYQDVTSHNILHYIAMAYEGDSIEVITYLMSLNGIIDLLEDRNYYDDTPLLSFARSNKMNSCKYLIEHYQANIHATDQNGCNILYTFAGEGNVEMVNYFYQLEPSMVNEKEQDNYYTPLMSAVSYNHLDVTKYLIEQCQCDYQQISKQQLNIFHLVMERGSIEFVDYIYNLNPQFLESIDVNSFTPLVYACAHNNLPVFNHLITKYDANPFILATKRQECGLIYPAIRTNNSAMIEAVSHAFETCRFRFTTSRNPQISKFKLPNGYPRLVGEWIGERSLVARDSLGDSPIYFTLYSHKLQSLKTLIRLKANITTTNNNIAKFTDGCDTILHYAYNTACDNEDYSIFQYLLSDECLNDWNYQNELKFNDAATIQLYGQKDPIHDQLSTPQLVTEIISKYDVTSLKLLIERNAQIDVNYCNDEGENILHILFSKDPDGSKGDKTNIILEIMDCLLSLPITDTDKAKVLSHNELHQSQSTPLLYAASNLSFPIVQQLLHVNSNINDRDETGQNLLHIAGGNVHYSMIGELLQHYPEQLQSQLYQHDSLGLLPFHNTIFTTTSQLEIQQAIQEHFNTADTVIPNILREYFRNITSYIQHDPTLLIQPTLSNSTILHIIVVDEDLDDGDGDDGEDDYDDGEDDYDDGEDDYDDNDDDDDDHDHDYDHGEDDDDDYDHGEDDDDDDDDDYLTSILMNYLIDLICDNASCVL